MNIENVGIWMDTKQAVFIALSKNSSNVSIIESHIETRERIPGESKSFGRFGNQYTNTDSAKEARRKQQTKVFFKNLTEALRGEFPFVIFGPANMKHEFEKEIESNADLNSRLEAIVTTDNMTQNQKVAWVKDFFEQINITPTEE